MSLSIGRETLPVGYYHHVCAITLNVDQIASGFVSSSIFWRHWPSYSRVSIIPRHSVQDVITIDKAFPGLVILGCVPGAPGSSSTASEYYLLQFNTANGTATTRLRTGYTGLKLAMNAFRDADPWQPCACRCRAKLSTAQSRSAKRTR